MVTSSTEPRGTHTVVLHERDRVNCDLLSDHLSGRDDLEVVGCAVRPEEALELVDAREPDLVVAHAGVPHEGTLRLARRLRASEWSPDLVVFGLDGDVGTVLGYLEAGASACVHESQGLDELDATLREVLSDRVALAPEVGYRAIRRLAELAEICSRAGLDVDRLERLTPREREVLRLLGERLSNREIAERLYVEVSTVKSHVHSVLDKLEASGREEAARYLLLAGPEDER